MEIVIDIPEEEYKRMKEKSMFGRVDIWKDAIRNGKVLPKGHGALKDADEVMKVMERNFDMQDLYLPIHFKQFALDEARTIVPADKEGAE